MSNEIRIVLVAVGILALFMAFVMLEVYYVNVTLDRQVRDRQGVIYRLETQYAEIRTHLRGIDDHLGLKRSGGREYPPPQAPHPDSEK